MVGYAGTGLPRESKALLDQAQETVRGALTEVRGISARLRPGVLEDLGLVSALTSLATQLSEMGSTLVTRDIGDPGELTPEQSLAIYRICQEALTNVIRHARAAHALVHLRSTADGVELVVEDDGIGAHAPAGTGRQGMTERALLVGGDLTVSIRPEGGTRVRLWVPLGT